MQTLGDIVQVGLILLGVFAFGRVLWRAWIRPMFASSVPRVQSEQPRIRWSIHDELARIFLTQGEQAVNTSQIVMSNSTDVNRQTNQTGRQTDAVSEHDQLWQAFLLDRTRARLIAVMVDSQLSVGEIRGLLKGDNGAIGNEIEAARKQTGAPLPAEYRTPVVNRPTSAQFRSELN